jgi:NAD(P)H-dependent flavin oxidoreductase YrpB (nitropropane dioxygenase family)
MRRAIGEFPLPRAGEDALRRYLRPQGRPADEPYKLVPLLHHKSSRDALELVMLAAFVEVWLAREGHRGLVGINLLTKIQLPTLPALYGAMLAGVDTVVMGAGVPREIPGALDALAEHRPARLRFDVEGLRSTAYLDLDPAAHWGSPPAALDRPRFLPIVSSNLLASMLARKANGRVDGFIVEGPAAGGHNAPPRGGSGAEGEPIYGDRDVVDLVRLQGLGLPYWLAGGAGHPDRLAEARAAGASGVQVGTLFAYCDESGLAESIKRSVLARAAVGEVSVRTEPRVSPTGYPFKVVDWPENPAHTSRERERVCDLGYLRVAYVDADGKIGYRCSGEPVAAFVAKGGDEEDTEGRHCLCNALLAVIGHPQVRRDGFVEPPILTSGDDLPAIGRFLRGRTRYTAADVVDYLLGTS